MTVKQDREGFYNIILNQRVTYEVPNGQFPGEHNDVRNQWTKSRAWSLHSQCPMGRRQDAIRCPVVASWLTPTCARRRLRNYTL